MSEVLDVVFQVHTERLCYFRWGFVRGSGLALQQHCQQGMIIMSAYLLCSNKEVIYLDFWNDDVVFLLSVLKIFSEAWWDSWEWRVGELKKRPKMSVFAFEWLMMMMMMCHVWIVCAVSFFCSPSSSRSILMVSLWYFVVISLHGCLVYFSTVIDCPWSLALWFSNSCCHESTENVHFYNTFIFLLWKELLQNLSIQGLLK